MLSWVYKNDIRQLQSVIFEKLTNALKFFKRVRKLEITWVFHATWKYRPRTFICQNIGLRNYAGTENFDEIYEKFSKSQGKFDFSYSNSNLRRR